MFSKNANSKESNEVEVMVGLEALHVLFIFFPRQVDC